MRVQEHTCSWGLSHSGLEHLCRIPGLTEGALNLLIQVHHIHITIPPQSTREQEWRKSELAGQLLYLNLASNSIRLCGQELLCTVLGT